MKILYAMMFLLVIQSSAAASERKPGTPAEKDKCPVCGMFPYKYPYFIAQIVFKDGNTVYFDGTKDMMKYYFGLKKYAPSRTSSDIENLFVTEYYSLKPIEGRGAYYVLGSDVHGPMGRELIPFKTKKDAEKFTRDHRGRIFKFGDITAAAMKSLD